MNPEAPNFRRDLEPPPAPYRLSDMIRGTSTEYLREMLSAVRNELSARGEVTA